MIDVIEFIHELYERFENEIEINILEINKKIIRKSIVFQIFIEKKDINKNIAISDCVKFSKYLSRAFDEVESQIPYEEYSFEVSSPGVYRKLKTFEDFERFQTKKVRIKFHEEVDGLNKVTGILEEAKDNKIKVNLGKKTLNIDYSNIKQASLTI